MPVAFATFQEADREAAEYAAAMRERKPSRYRAKVSYYLLQALDVDKRDAIKTGELDEALAAVLAKAELLKRGL